ncbi:MAG TPA: hypothetical protein VEL76_41625, partial [Gemmataceae bacterium]|nr:hypothetical protein [Gemmataceae bacterium]
VPTAFAERLVAPELTLSDFLSVQGPAQTAVLFVIVTDIDFIDRVGYNPANPPSDAEIRQRVDQRWQLQKFLPDWSGNPEASPGLLIGVFGSPGRQTVIASARIDRSNWAAVQLFPEGKLRVPLREPLDLDAFGLRGRRIAPSAGLMFGGIPAQFYIMLGIDGIALGGHHLRKGLAAPRKRAPNKPLQQTGPA